MLEAAYAGLVGVFRPEVFLLMLLAVFIGVVVGFIPGIGGNFLLAMMIPFTFGMEPIQGFAFLLGGHAVISTGSAISAILFNAPGSGNSAATVLDGYPLAKQGHGGRAIGASLSASGIGGIVGAASLIIAIPVVRPLVLTFGPPELFMLCLMGISFIAMLSEKSMVKGLIAGGVGLLLATVGQDPQTGIVRFGMGQIYLADGMKLVPVVVGLFAVSEMIALGARGGTIAQEMAKVGGRVIDGLFDTFRHIGLTIRASLIGVWIGILPGLGGNAAGWFAYGHAVQSSKDPERFGKGAIEGVIGPEAANNSKEGGDLIPTIAFGIPGGSGMAILLGAFIILGVAPGPKMLTEHLATTFSMAWTLAIANVIGVVFGMLLAEPLAKLTYLRVSFIVPAIMAFSTLGAYTTSNHFGDLLVAMFFGVLGYEMAKCGYPKPPLVVGLVLGEIAEVNLQISNTLWGPAFLLRPITLILFLVMVAALAYPFIKKRRAKAPTIEGGVPA